MPHRRCHCRDEDCLSPPTTNSRGHCPNSRDLELQQRKRQKQINHQKLVNKNIEQKHKFQSKLAEAGRRNSF